MVCDPFSFCQTMLTQSEDGIGDPNPKDLEN